MDIQALIEKQQEANKLKARILLMPGVNIQYLTLEDVDTLTTQTVIATAEAVIEMCEKLGDKTIRTEYEDIGSDAFQAGYADAKSDLIISLRAQLKKITK